MAMGLGNGTANGVKRVLQLRLRPGQGLRLGEVRTEAATEAGTVAEAGKGTGIVAEAGSGTELRLCVDDGVGQSRVHQSC